MADLLSRVAALIDGHREYLVDLLQRLVRIPSVVGTGGPEGEAQQLMAEEMRAAGMEVDTWEPRREELQRYRGYVPVENRSRLRIPWSRRWRQ